MCLTLSQNVEQIPKTLSDYPAPQNSKYKVFNEEKEMWVVTAYFTEPGKLSNRHLPIIIIHKAVTPSSCQKITSSNDICMRNFYSWQMKTNA